MDRTDQPSSPFRELETWLPTSTPTSESALALAPPETVPPCNPVEVRRRWGEIHSDVASKIEEVCAAESPWPLVLLGPAGTGKTCAALALLDRVNAGRWYATVPQLAADHVTATQDRLFDGLGNMVTTRALTNRWAERRITCLDELGARDRVSDFQYELVKRCIDDRQGRPSVFISNLSLDDLLRVYDDRICSRLAAGTVVRFACPDRRLRRAGGAA